MRYSGTALLVAALLSCKGSGEVQTKPQPSSAISKTPAEPQSEPEASPRASNTATGTVSGKKFKSKSLGVKKAYQIYLPADYATAPAKRYPVLYLLHGLGGNETNWRDLGWRRRPPRLVFLASW